MLVTAIGVKLSSPGPVFLRQERVGRYKKPFIMLKFRSMRVNDEENVGWSTNEDPRRTKFGSFIRKFSIDELPQLFNVLIGQMSLIGPRPEMPYHVSHFKEDVPLYLVRQQVRPGMTGWAQVNGLRGATSIEKRVEYDIWYIENWSIGLEIRIFFKTLFGGMINKEII
jgi:lipopolysaccharide/colanic/teichoic acid biosynthesis glycosyltransferase